MSESERAYVLSWMWSQVKSNICRSFHCIVWLFAFVLVTNTINAKICAIYAMQTVFWAVVLTKKKELHPIWYSQMKTHNYNNITKERLKECNKLCFDGERWYGCSVSACAFQFCTFCLLSSLVHKWRDSGCCATAFQSLIQLCVCAMCIDAVCLFFMRMKRTLMVVLYTCAVPSIP